MLQAYTFLSTRSCMLTPCRGLKSFRSSPWDPKEWLPKEYARVFAFENLKRAQKWVRPKGGVHAVGSETSCTP